MLNLLEPCDLPVVRAIVPKTPSSPFKTKSKGLLFDPLAQEEETTAAALFLNEFKGLGQQERDGFLFLSVDMNDLIHDFVRPKKKKGVLISEAEITSPEVPASLQSG